MDRSKITIIVENLPPMEEFFKKLQAGMIEKFGENVELPPTLTIDAMQHPVAQIASLISRATSIYHVEQVKKQRKNN